MSWLPTLLGNVAVMKLSTLMLAQNDTKTLPKGTTIVAAQFNTSWHILISEPDPKEPQDWSKAYTPQKSDPS